MTTEEVEDPIWWHWVTIIVPEGAKSNKGLLFINGGSHNTAQPKKPKDTFLKVALGSQSVVVALHNIPNQPTVFKNDDFGPRVEDELIAFGWKKFLEGGANTEDAEWLAHAQVPICPHVRFHEQQYNGSWHTTGRLAKSCVTHCRFL